MADLVVARDDLGAAGTAGSPDLTLRLSNVTSLSQVVPVRQVTASDNIGLEDGIVEADCTSGAITLTLPAAADGLGRTFRVKKTDAGANTLTLAAQSGETIDGSSTSSIAIQYGERAIYSDGTSYYSDVSNHNHSGTITGKLTQSNTHQSPDTDSATTSLHHTLGTGANQAAAGNHTHTGTGKYTIQGNAGGDTFSGTIYLGPGIATNGTENNVKITIPFACTLSNFSCRTSTTQPHDQPLTLTVNDNGTGTALVITVPIDGTANVYSDTSDTITWTAGHEFSIKKRTTSISASAAVWGWSVEVNPT